MIVNEKYSFAFIHIPKCAGSSIRNVLKKIDGSKAYFGIKNIPNFGNRDFAHLDFCEMSKVSPDVYVEVSNLTLFAIVREPKARFYSSVSQYFKSVLRKNISLCSSDEIRFEVKRIIERLAVEDSSSSVDLIHFNPQINYIIDEDICRVQTYNIKDINIFLKEISSLVGYELILENNANQSQFVSFGRLKSIFRMCKPLTKLLPSGIKDYLKRFLYGNKSNIDWNVIVDKEIDDFIYSYYIKDFDIFEATK